MTDQLPDTVEPSSTVLTEGDYDTIASAVMETERGRWFLFEYARRHRNADTTSVLEAIERLETKIESADTTGAEAGPVALISHNILDVFEAIAQVKREVQELGNAQEPGGKFNSATNELEAIVDQTETATSEILEAAEKIQEVAWQLREEGAPETLCDILDTKSIDIYTACSFQDLTGQRTQKVVGLVSYVERRVAKMMGLLGLSEGEVSPSPDVGAPSSDASDTDEELADARPDAHLLNGPALAGEGIEQDDVDALFNMVESGEAAVETLTPQLTDDDAHADAEKEVSAPTAETQQDIFEPEAVDELETIEEPTTAIIDDEIFVDLPDDKPLDETLGILASSAVGAMAADELMEVELLAFAGASVGESTDMAGGLSPLEISAEPEADFAIEAEGETATTEHASTPPNFEQAPASAETPPDVVTEEEELDEVAEEVLDAEFHRTEGASSDELAAASEDIDLRGYTPAERLALFS